MTPLRHATVSNTRHATKQTVCLRLLDPLETADLWLPSHLTNLQLFVVDLLKGFECQTVYHHVKDY